MQIAELESEEVVAFAFGEGSATTAGLGLLEELAGFAALFGLGDDDTSVDAHLATVSGRIGRQREEVAAIEGLVVVLLEELVDFDVGKTGGDIGADTQAPQGEDDAGFFQPGFEAEGFGGNIA